MISKYNFRFQDIYVQKLALVKKTFCHKWKKLILTAGYFIHAKISIRYSIYIFLGLNIALDLFLKFCIVRNLVKPSAGKSRQLGKICLSRQLRSSIRDHMLFCDHGPSFEDFTILTHGTNKFLLEIKESLLIKLLEPELNKHIRSAPLYLFDKV